MALTQNNETPRVEPLPSQPSPSAPPPLEFDLWMLAALGCLPMTVLILAGPFPWAGRIGALLFVFGIGVHCYVRRRHGRSLSAAAFTGAWLLPAICLPSALFNGRFLPDVIPGGLCLAVSGAVAGLVVAKQIEAVLALKSIAIRRMRHGTERRISPGSIQEQLDEASTALEAPPMYGLPRRFGVRGTLIVTTWAAVVMSGLRALGAPPWVYFMVIVFAIGTLAAQVLAFKGQHPIKASMWAGGFLLPAEVVAMNLFWWPQMVANPGMDLIFEIAALCAWLVPIGILLGAVAGAVGGWLYYAGEEFLVWLTRGVPKIVLEPIADADADVLLAWINGPKFCQRWAGAQLAWPLDRKQLLDRFATAQGEQPFRRVFKAVDIHTGNMLAYIELDEIDCRVHKAWLSLPLVDPDASERGRLSVLLLRAVAKEAFDKLGLVSIWVAANSDQSEVALCCDKAWLQDYYFRPLPNKPGACWTAVYVKPSLEQ